MTMDGPVVKWTVNDLASSSNELFMTYHVMGAGWDALSPAGCLLGGVLYTTGIFRKSPGVLATCGTVGFLTGCAGMALGLAKMTSTAAQGEAATPPWTDDGLQNRVDGLKHNFKVRVLDLSAWTGMGVATLAMAGLGGPAALGLSSGALGAIQGLTLGSSAGSVSAFACIYASLMKKNDEDHDE